MKRLLAVLMFFGGSALLAMEGSAGCPVGGDSCVSGGSEPDNVVHIEAELLFPGKKSYDQLLKENLKAKRALLNDQRSRGRNPGYASAGQEGVEESKGGSLKPEILEVYLAADLPPAEAEKIEEAVQKEYQELSIIQKRLSPIERVRRQHIDRYISHKLASLASASKVAGSVKVNSQILDLRAIFDCSVFKDVHSGFAEDINSPEGILKEFKNYRSKAFGLIGKTSGANKNVTGLFKAKLKRYMNNLAVVDFLYLNLVSVPREGARFGFFTSTNRAANYKDVINTSVQEKVAAVEKYFDFEEEVLLGGGM